MFEIFHLNKIKRNKSCTGFPVNKTQPWHCVQEGPPVCPHAQALSSISALLSVLHTALPVLQEPSPSIR